MITILTDNVEIYQLLEKREILFEDFFSDKLILFDFEDDCYLVIYSSSTRNFISFKAESFLQEINALPSLIDKIQDYSDDSIPPFIRNEAIKLIENKMHTKNNNRFYFDAH